MKQLYLLLFLLPATLSANVYLVSNDTDAGPGSLRQAIIEANARLGLDTIDIMASIDTIALTSHQDVLGINHLSTNDSLHIIGRDVVLTTQDSGRIIQANAFLDISDVTFSGAIAAFLGNAGAIWVNANVNFYRCRFEGNSAANHGGATLINQNNEMLPGQIGMVNYVDCIFDSNHGDVEGGAIYVRNAEVLFQNPCFISNTSSGSAPNIFNNQGIVTLTGTIKFDSSPHVVNGVSGSVVLGASFSVPLGIPFAIE